MRHLMVCDGTWLAHRSFSMSAKNPSQESRERITTSQVVTQVFQYATRLEATHILVAFDGGANFRLKVFPLYKANRNDRLKTHLSSGKVTLEHVERLLEDVALEMVLEERGPAKPIHLALDALRSKLELLGVPSVHFSQLEADDCLKSGGSLVEKGAFDKVSLVCRDKDLFQCVTTGVQLYTPAMANHPEEFISELNLARVIQEYIGVRTERKWNAQNFLNYQILIGDPGDYVPALMSKKQAIEVIDEHGTVGEWLRNGKDSEEFFSRNEAFLSRNRDLVTMVSTAFDGWRTIRTDTSFEKKALPVDLYHTMRDAIEGYWASKPSFGRKNRLF